MQFIVTKQIAVEAETPEEAVAKSGGDGKTISLASNPRPPQPVQQAPGRPLIPVGLPAGAIPQPR
jgi:hypothetical protein